LYAPASGRLTTIRTLHVMRRVVPLLVAVLVPAGAALAQAGQTPGPTAAPPAALGKPPAGGLQLGFADEVLSTNPLQNPWYARAADAGADLIDVTLDWGGVAPGKPAGDPTDPGNAAYNFSSTDAIVQAAANAGLGVLMRVSNPPAWADGPNRPAGVTPGTWKTDPTAYGQFARAVARHYDGSHGVPRVSTWQAGGEVNLGTYFQPQWVRSHGAWVAESAVLYRRLLNAFYAGVKAVSPSNVVAMAGLAPFGDQPGGKRVPPALFLRTLLCLKGGSLRTTSCPNPAHYDALSHHPYSVGGPYDLALNTDDVSLADLGKLTRIEKRALATHRLLPRGRKGLWITEFSWDTKPPDPDGVPEKTMERWIPQALEEMWQEGANRVLWYQIVDAAPNPSYSTTFQGGMYLLNGHAKPQLRAFQFPFVVRPRRHAKALVWGRAPVAGTVSVQVRSKGGWRTIWRTQAARHGVFHRHMGLGRGTYRAAIGSQRSLAYRVG
jgi:hypothetical protein